MNLISARASRWEQFRVVLKLLLPSWNFFNDFAEVTRLDFCWCDSDAARDENWQPLHPDHSTADLLRIFYNPHGNLELLEKSLIDRIATGLREHSDAVVNFEDSEAGGLLRRLVSSRLQGLDARGAPLRFRFRVVIVAPEGSVKVLFESSPQVLEGRANAHD